MTAFSKACIEANREISVQLKENFDISLLEKSTVGAGGDVSKQADLLAEEIFVKHLGIYGTIESEESGIIGEGVPSIIIDPLDGSANFASGFPYYGTSVAKLDETGKLSCAVVCNLTNGDIFVKDGNSKPMISNLCTNEVWHMSDIEEPEIGLFEKAYAHPSIVAALLEAGYKFRSPGATALSLAYARSVSFFLFMGQARLYDIVAGIALCEGLEVIVEEDYVIVSQSITVAKDIESMIRRSKV
jgi:myo-inositol-1(or 4)-monophosphatase